MKTSRNGLAALALSACCLGACNAAADLEVSASVQVHAVADFDTPLAPQGAWVSVGSYGRCWHPVGVEAGWRPYCDGTWVWTDCGWYWSTDEPWGWACYHYGTWVDDPGAGWVWVPGIEWAPAWVEWRVGGGYIGWAPLAPRGVILAPGLFGFVEIGHFNDHVRPATLVINNATIINKTARVSGSSRETRSIDGRSQQVVVNNGPKVADIQKATGRQISAVPIKEAALQRRQPRSISTPDRGREPDKATQPSAEERGKTAPKDEGVPKSAAPERAGRPEAVPQAPPEPPRGKGDEASPRVAPREGGNAPVERPPRGDSGAARGQGERDDDRGGGGGRGR